MTVVAKRQAGHVFWHFYRFGHEHETLAPRALRWAWSYDQNCFFIDSGLEKEWEKGIVHVRTFVDIKHRLLDSWYVMQWWSWEADRRTAFVCWRQFASRKWVSERGFIFGFYQAHKDQINDHTPSGFIVQPDHDMHDRYRIAPSSRDSGANCDCHRLAAPPSSFLLSHQHCTHKSRNRRRGYEKMSERWHGLVELNEENW